MGSEEDTYNVMFHALKHPVRRRILRRLDAGPASFTGLLNELGIDNGLLNYHLNSLGELVAKGPDERYRLSEFGAAALSLTRRVEEPVKRGNGTISVLGWRTPVSRVLALVAVLLLSSNVYLACSLREASSDNTNALGWALLQARGSYGESVNVLGDALDGGVLEPGAVGVIQNDMMDAARYLRIASVLDRRHREQWDALREAADGLAQASQQIMGRMASSGGTEIELSLSQKRYLEEVAVGLERMGEAFPEELVLGSRPRVVYDEDQTADAVTAAVEFEGSLNGLYEAFSIGRPFEVVLGEGYIWVEDDT